MTTKLRHARERSGLTLREVGRRIGLTAATVSLMETAQSRPSVGTLYEYARCVGGDLTPLADALAPYVAEMSGGARRGGHTPRQAAQ